MQVLLSLCNSVTSEYSLTGESEMDIKKWIESRCFMMSWEQENFGCWNVFYRMKGVDVSNIL